MRTIQQEIDNNVRGWTIHECCKQPAQDGKITPKNDMNHVLYRRSNKYKCN